MNRRASKHANDVRASEFWLLEEVRAIRSRALEIDPLDDDHLWHTGADLAAADEAHWRRCLISARKNGAKADYYLAQLNKWNDGFYGRIGNLCEPLFQASATRMQRPIR